MALNYVTYKGTVKIDGFNILLKVISPSWAPGFECLKDCGACCIVDPPKYPIKVPTIRCEELDTYICRYLTKDNLCSIYNKRPIGCRMFPFNIIGVEKGEIIISPSLSCPGTNVKKPINVSELRSLLTKNPIYDTLKKLLEIDNTLFSDPTFIKFYSELQSRLNKGIEKIFRKKKKLLYPHIYNLIRKYFKDKISTIPNGLEVKKLSEIIAIYPRDFLYIASQFNSYDIYHVYIKGKKCIIKNRHGVKKVFYLSSVPNYDDKAWKILEEYAKFQLIRPLFSAAIHRCGVMGQLYPHKILESFFSYFSSNFIDIDIISWIIASRDKTKEINVQSVREVIAWADGKMSARYRGPYPFEDDNSSYFLSIR